MLHFTIRDWAKLLGAAVTVLAVVCAAAVVVWSRNDPWTRAGSLRRGLDNVQQGTADRDRQVNELTKPNQP